MVGRGVVEGDSGITQGAPTTRGERKENRYIVGRLKYRIELEIYIYTNVSKDFLGRRSTVRVLWRIVRERPSIFFFF